MASINRRFNTKVKDGKWLMIFIVSLGRKLRWDISSQVRLEKEFWAPSFRVNYKHTNYKQLNILLDQVEIKLKSKALELAGTQNGEIHHKHLQLQLNQLVTDLVSPMIINQQASSRIEFIEFADAFIRESSYTKTSGTIRSYKQTINRIRKFNPTLEFKDIDLTFYTNFISSLTCDGLKNNTAGKHIKILKTLLNEALDRGYPVNVDFRKKRFEVLKEEVDTVYITPEEIKTLNNYRELLTNAKRRILGLFLIGCHTGLRFSDFSQLNMANLHKDEFGTYISLRTLKTAQHVVIPINSKVREILSYYKGIFPKSISNQKTNKALKEICHKAGIVSMVEIKSKSGGTTQTELFPKNELISTHTARQSFATNAFLAGVPTLAIMKITGHKTERAFMEYIKASQFENAKVLSTHPFFR